MWGGVFGVASTYAIGEGLTAFSSGIFIGGASGFLGNVAGQRASGTSFSCIDWRQATFQGMVGMAAGLAAGPAFGPLAIANAPLAAASLSGIASLFANSFTPTNLGGFGFYPLVHQ